MTTIYQNVFVGMSLQNKGLSENDFRKIVERAKSDFEYRKLVFLIADQIELINQRVFTKGHEKSLRKKIEDQASELESMIKAACDGPELRSGRILTCRWLDILDSGYWRTFFEVQRIFAENSGFREDVKYAIKEYAHRRKEHFTDAETHYLCQYVLHEIPTLIFGIRLNGKHFNSMIYPAPGNASIDVICRKLTSKGYAMYLFEPPFCKIRKYLIALD